MHHAGLVHHAGSNNNSNNSGGGGGGGGGGGVGAGAGAGGGVGGGALVPVPGPPMDEKQVKRAELVESPTTRLAFKVQQKKLCIVCCGVCVCVVCACVRVCVRHFAKREYRQYVLFVIL